MTRRGGWRREKIPANGGARVAAYRRGPFLVWRDKDVEHGEWAAAVVSPAGSERILGHADSAKQARALCDDEVSP